MLDLDAALRILSTVAKVTRRNPVDFLEQPVEVAHIVETDSVGHIADADVCCKDEIDSAGEPILYEVLMQRLARVQFDLAVEIIGMVTEDLAQGFVGNVV